jgi:flagellar assembly protein FliH
MQRPAFLQLVSTGRLPRLAAFQPVAGSRLPPRPAAFRARRAEAGTGSIASSGHALNPDGEPFPGDASTTSEARTEALARVAHAVEVLRLQAERLAEQARNDALEVGFLVARRILEAELSTGPEALFSLVRSALKRSGDSRRVVVRVHPDDAPRLVNPVAAGELSSGAASVEVQGDAALEPGDVVVDTDFGRVDGRLRTRLEELYRAAGGALEEGVA